MAKRNVGQMLREGIGKWNEMAGENQVYDIPGTGPQREIGSRMGRKEDPDRKKSIAEDYLELDKEADEIEKGRNKAKADTAKMGPKYKKGGSVSSASKRADGCAVRGKTKGRMV